MQSLFTVVVCGNSADIFFLYFNRRSGFENWFTIYILFFQQDLWIKIKEIDTVGEKTKRIFKSFIANAVISQVNNLQGKDREKYIEEIKEKKILEDLSRDSLKQKLKYNYLKKRLK